MKVQNIKKAIARIFKNIRWFMLVDHGESVDTVGQMLDRIDHLVLTHEDDIDALKMKIEELTQQLEAVDELVEQKLNDYDFDELMTDAIREHDFSYEIGEAVAEHDFDDAIREQVEYFDFDDKIGEALDRYCFDDKLTNFMRENDMGGRIESQIDRKIAAMFSTARIVFGDVEEPKQTEALLDEVAVHPFVDPAIDAVIAFEDSE